MTPAGAVALLILVAVLAYGGFRIGPRFLIKRIIGLVFVLIGVTFVTFILGYLSPGTAAENYCNGKCTTAFLKAKDHQLGLDLPWYAQYGHFLNQLIHFSLGISYVQRGRSVWSILSAGVPISAQVGLSALVLSLIIGITIGILAAVRNGTLFDGSTMTLALIFFAVPTFVTIPFYQLFMVYLAQRNLPHLPVSGWGTPVQAVAPIVLLTLLELGYYARLSRTVMLEVLNQDYVRTARAKGLTQRIVVFRHAFRNALVPLVTAVGPAVAFVVGGAFFTEVFFNIPGIGAAAVNSISQKDMPVVQGTVILVAVAVAMMNLVVDMVYGILDPRIKVS